MPQPVRAEDPLKLFQYRLIGPFRGGRVTAVAGIPSQPKVYYFGATGGGVWKTTDGGVNWEPVSDKYFKTGSVGAIDVSQSDPNVIYVGMGESPVRGNVSHGDGVYKSTDAGKTWKHVGLGDSRQIGRVRIHPKDPNIVYVAAMGHLWGPNQERGLFRTTDGGKTWQNILFRSDKAGAFDISFDPANPNVIFAAFWQIQRTPYSLISGGEGSADLQVDRRRRHVDGHFEEPRNACRCSRQDRRHRFAGEPEPRMGDDRGKGRRALPLGRRRRNVAADIGQRRRSGSGRGTTRASTPTRRTRTSFMCSTSVFTNRSTAAGRSRTSARRIRTITICGSPRTTTSG